MIGTHESLLKRVSSHGLGDSQVMVQLNIEVRAMPSFRLAEIILEEDQPEPSLTSDSGPFYLGAYNALERAAFCMLTGDKGATESLVEACVYAGLGGPKGHWGFGGPEAFLLQDEVKRRWRGLVDNLLTYIRLWLEHGGRLKKPEWSIENA